MGTAKSKNTKSASSKTNAPAISVTVTKAKKAAKPLTKKEYVESAKPEVSSRAVPVNKQKALTKEDLQKRQKSKGTSRKQGGKKYDTLKAAQLKTMAHIKEAAPSKVD
jgi:hypothetical protein